MGSAWGESWGKLLVMKCRSVILFYFTFSVFVGMLRLIGSNIFSKL
ncbi:hypothetical protein BH10BDE1_BH10BDE1_13550 [soil metagenome]